MNQKGEITLIEVMIVIAIIGILAAVSIPKFVQMTSHSNTVYLVPKPNGTTVKCKQMETDQCGAYCYDCEDGARYHCVQGVREVQEPK